MSRRGRLIAPGSSTSRADTAIRAHDTHTGPAAGFSNPKSPPDSHLAMMLVGFQIANPDIQNLSNDTFARMFRLKGALMQAGPANLDRWQQAITKGSAATGKPVAPVQMCTDAFDGGTGIPVARQTGCGDRVRHLGAAARSRPTPTTTMSPCQTAALPSRSGG